MYDVVIEAAGSESSMDRSIELARPRGVISYVGVYEKSFLWPHRAAFSKEVSIVGAVGYGPAGGPESSHVWRTCWRPSLNSRSR
jgi:threonine dehydrogenase-like Zn-dependent dehydrogenase